MESFFDKLKNYWFLIACIATLSSAWGATQVKIQSLEQAIKSNAETNTEVAKLKSHTERVDERTKAILESQARQERLIELLIRAKQSNEVILQTQQNKKEPISFTKDKDK